MLTADARLGPPWYVWPVISPRPELMLSQEELDLLNHTAVESRDRTDHELYTAPVLTRGAFLAGGFSSQYGVLGGVLGL